MSEDRKTRFNLAEEIKKIRQMGEEDLVALQDLLEQDLVLLETQLSLYEEGVEERSDLWYKQATFVFHGKTHLLRKIAGELGTSTTPFLAMTNTMYAHEIPYEVRKYNNTQSVILRGIDSSVSMLFDKKGNFVEAR